MSVILQQKSFNNYEETMIKKLSENERAYCSGGAKHSGWTTGTVCTSLPFAGMLFGAIAGVAAVTTDNTAPALNDPAQHNHVQRRWYVYNAFMYPVIGTIAGDICWLIIGHTDDD